MSDDMTFCQNKRHIKEPWHPHSFYVEVPDEWCPAKEGKKGEKRIERIKKNR